MRKTVFTIIALLSLALIIPNQNGHAADPAGKRTNSQSVYVPVYSSIRYFNDDMVGLSVKISIRNTDPALPIRLNHARYYDNQGTFIRDFLEKPADIPAFGTQEIFIKQSELRGDTGANFKIDWTADKPASPPLIEAVMIGTRGVNSFAFTSRGVVISP